MKVVEQDKTEYLSDLEESEVAPSLRTRMKNRLDYWMGMDLRNKKGALKYYKEMEKYFRKNEPALWGKKFHYDRRIFYKKAVAILEALIRKETNENNS